MLRRSASSPIELQTVGRQHAKRCPACIWALAHCEFTVEIRWEENSFHVGIEQDFLWVKTMDVGNRLPRHRVSVITTLPELAGWNSAMPHPARLVTQIVKTVRQQRVHEICGSVKQ